MIDPSSLTEGPSFSSAAHPPDNPSLPRASSSPSTISIGGSSISSDTFPQDTMASHFSSSVTSGWDCPSRPVHSLEIPTVLTPASSRATIQPTKSASGFPYPSSATTAPSAPSVFAICATKSAARSFCSNATFKFDIITPRKLMVFPCSL